MRAYVAQYMSAIQSAVLAARTRTGCEWIGTYAMPHYRSVVCLVIYRTRGSSIVLEMSEALEQAKAVDFLSKVTREDICARLVARIEELEARIIERGASPRLVYDAGLLKDHANAFKGE